MNSSIATTAIVFIATIMSMGAFVPILPNAHAAIGDEGDCPTGFDEIFIETIRDVADRTRAERIDQNVGITADGLICIKELPQRTVLVDNILP